MNVKTFRSLKRAHRIATVHSGYQSILVAMDFSPPAEAALKQAVWLARQTAGRVVLAHTRPSVTRMRHMIADLVALC